MCIPVYLYVCLMAIIECIHTYMHAHIYMQFVLLSMIAGAMYAIRSQVNLNKGSRLFKNTAESSGGAIYLNGGQVVLSDIYVSNNSAIAGAAVSSSGARISVNKCSFDRNLVVGGYGGAFRLYGLDSVVDIVQSTLSFNSATRGTGCTIESTGCGGGGAIIVTGNTRLTLSGNKNQTHHFRSCKCT